MTHTLTLPEWQLTHFRQHNECLLLLPVVPPIPESFVAPGIANAAQPRRHVWRHAVEGRWIYRDAPFYVGDVLDFGRVTYRSIENICGDIHFIERGRSLRKQVVSVTAKQGLCSMFGIYEIQRTGLDISGLVEGFEIESEDDPEGNPDDFREIAYKRHEQQWNADHPETPWNDKLWVWAVELRNEPAQE